MENTEMIDGWSEKLRTNPDGGELLQEDPFLDNKTRSGWKVVKLKLDLPDSNSAYCAFLVRKVPFLGEIWYSPRGPGVISLQQLDFIIPQIVSNAENAFCIKLEPKIMANNAPQKALRKIIVGRNLKSVKPIQANWNTVIIDLDRTVDEILAGFRQRARRSIRDAEKAEFNFVIGQNNPEDFTAFYDLYKETSIRGGFAIRGLDYYLGFWNAFALKDMGQLFWIVSKQGERVAGAFVIFNKTEGLYKDGASHRDAGNKGVAHLLQYQIMIWLKNRGVHQYDLHGTPPQTELENNQHPLYSLGLFKTSFSSSEIESTIGAFDVIVRRRSYSIWEKRAQRISQSVAWRIKKQIYY
jgi:lipid II:glycine glycyltransferase (peptidoglycan interpeptide bridge formation enzyme)